MLQRLGRGRLRPRLYWFATLAFVSPGPDKLGLDPQGWDLRSAPDGNFSNNWSTRGNVNQHTGAAGTKVSPPANYGLDVQVRGYARKDGTYVAPHMRSNPDGKFENNWSTKGNTNPYTGQLGTRVTPDPRGTLVGGHLNADGKYVPSHFVTPDGVKWTAPPPSLSKPRVAVVPGPNTYRPAPTPPSREPAEAWWKKPPTKNDVKPWWDKAG